MPSEAAKRRQAQKKAQKQASSRSAQKRTVTADTPVPGPESKEQSTSDVKSIGATAGPSPVVNGSTTSLSSGVAGIKLSQRSCTGE